jgi:hypothetical protein
MRQLSVVHLTLAAIPKRIWLQERPVTHMGGFLPVRFRADNADTGLSLKERIAVSGWTVFGGKCPLTPPNLREC